MTKKEIGNILLGVLVSVFLLAVLRGTRIYPYDMFEGLVFHMLFSFVPYFILVFVFFFLVGDNVFGRIIQILAIRGVRIFILLCYVALFLVPKMDIRDEKELFSIGYLLIFCGALTITQYLNTRDRMQ